MSEDSPKILIIYIYKDKMTYLYQKYILRQQFTIKQTPCVHPVIWEDIQCPLTQHYDYLTENPSPLFYFHNNNLLAIYPQLSIVIRTLPKTSRAYVLHQTLISKKWFLLCHDKYHTPTLLNINFSERSSVNSL